MISYPDYLNPDEQKKQPNKLILAMLCLLAIVVTTVIVLLIIILVWWANDKFQVIPPIVETRNTSGWQKVAEYVRNAVDFDADPCDDFYQYACGKWQLNHPIPEDDLGNDGERIDNPLLAQNDVNRVLSDFLIEYVDQHDNEWPKAIDAASKAFRACNAYKGKDERTTKKLLNLINSHGGWPIIDPKWRDQQQDFNPYLLMGQMSSVYQTDTFLTPKVDVDWKNPEAKNLIYLFEGSLGLGSPEYYLDGAFDYMMNDYKDWITTVAVALATEADTLNQTHDNFEIYVNNIIDLETQIAKYLTKEPLDYDSIYIETNYTSLTQDFDVIDWNGYFGGLLAPHIHSLSLVSPKFIIPALRPNPLSQKSYLHRIAEVLKVQTNKLNIANYLIWRLILPLIPHFLNFDQHVINSMLLTQNNSNKNQKAATENFCTNLVIKYMPFAVGRIYVQNVFGTENDENYNFAALMKNQISGSFQTMLTGVPWMGTYSKLKANEKIVNMVSNIGYPQWIMNNSVVDLFYQDLIRNITRIDSGDWFTWYHQMLANYGGHYWTQLLQNGHRDLFEKSPANANAWYRHPLNAISVSAAVMREPFFNKTFPQAWNYASVGFLIGRSMAEAFDYTGIQFGVNGLSKWLSVQSSQSFHNLIPCLTNQYDRYCYDFSDSQQTVCVNGNTTLDSNMADNAGVKVAYLAYKNFEFTHGKEPPLPGLTQIDMEQLFFIGYGHMLCQNITDYALESYLLQESKSPYKDRVLGTLKNFPEFGEAFKCKFGDNMHPPDICTIW